MKRLRPNRIEVVIVVIYTMLYCELVVVALLAEDELVRTHLQKLDVPVQVTQHVNPIQVLPARMLSSMYQQLGKGSFLSMKSLVVLLFSLFFVTRGKRNLLGTNLGKHSFCIHVVRLMLT